MSTAHCSVWNTLTWQHHDIAHQIRAEDRFTSLCGLASSNWFGLLGEAVIVVFDVTRPDQPSKRIKFNARPRVVFSGIAVSPDGKNIATSTEDG